MKNTILVLVTAVILAIALFAFAWWYANREETPLAENEMTDTATSTEAGDMSAEDKAQEVIGTSVDGRDIVAYHFGDGSEELLFVGGIHGGYSWNTSLVAYEAIEYFRENPEMIPENLSITVIPVMNPDGLEAVVGTTQPFDPDDAPTAESETVPGRFNGNDVDLNRNFDCDWEEEATWQNRTVSGGTRAFSEPESEAVRAYVAAHDPVAALVWYSAGGGVFASSCHNGVLEETRTLTNLYADASGYRPYESFNFYEITGDMVNWLAKEEIPAISVLLSTHTDVEWNKNRLGIEAMLEHYAE